MLSPDTKFSADLGSFHLLLYPTSLLSTPLCFPTLPSFDHPAFDAQAAESGVVQSDSGDIAQWHRRPFRASWFGRRNIDGTGRFWQSGSSRLDAYGYGHRPCIRLFPSCTWWLIWLYGSVRFGSVRWLRRKWISDERFWEVVLVGLFDGSLKLCGFASFVLIFWDRSVLL